MMETLPESKLTPRFPVGTQYQRRHCKNQQYVYTVVDYLTTFNLAGDLVGVSYTTDHIFSGQTVTECGVVETTIARNLINIEG